MTNNQQCETYNRIKLVLVEQGKTSRWLAKQIPPTKQNLSSFFADNQNIIINF